MKTLIAINNLTTIDQLAYANHIQFFYRLGKEFPADYFALCNPRRMSIDKMRNFSARAAIDHGFDYLMFVDDDVLLPFNAFKRLQMADKDIIAGITCIRGYPYHPMVFNFMGPLLGGPNTCHYMDDYLERADSNGIVECDAIGFSCCLIKVDFLKKIEPPFFITGEHHTEDIYFCARAKKEVAGTKIFADALVRTAHILGSEVVEPFNLEARKLFDEAVTPNIKELSAQAELRKMLIDPKVLRKGDYEKHIKEEIFDK